MKAAIDTPSLIFILKIAKLKELAESYFEKIYVAQEVYTEVFESKVSEELVPFDKLKPLFELQKPFKTLEANLGKGELAAISLAFERQVLFLTEDRKAKLFASSKGVKTSSALSILIKATQEKKITVQEAKKILFDLVDCGFYASSSLLAAVLKRFEEN